MELAMRAKIGACRSFSLLLGLLLISGCGRSYQLIGRVVILTSSGSLKEGIHEVTGHPMPSDGAPIAEATVTLFHEIEKDGSPIRTSIWHKDAETDKLGEFHLFDYATPGRKNLVGLEVKADGYTSTYTTYWDYMDPDYQYFFVVLSPAA
jgi:hypothetical protein